MEPVYRTVVGLCLTTFKLKNWDVQVSGTEHLPAEGGAVIATNHISYVDFIFVGAGVLRGPNSRLVRFAAKKEVFDHPVSGPLMRAMKHIPVDRGGEASATIDTAVEYLERGELVGMFPEATISRSFVPMPGKTGTVRMAQRAGVPIIPGAVWGSQRLFPKGRPRDLRRNVTISVDFGPAFTPSEDDDPVAATAELMSRIGTLVERAQDSYPDEPDDGGDWWVPTHLGGSAPTPEEAERIAREERERRRAARQRDQRSG